MPVIQELSRRQIDECVDELTRRQAPLSVNCRLGRLWFSLHSLVIERSDQKLWLAYPTAEEGPQPTIGVGLMLSLAFKIKHHKHVFTGPVEAVSDLSINGQPARAICISYPWRMQRIQRRAYNRAEVPRSRTVLATFWQSGLPDGADLRGEMALTWEGWVLNLSAGGFQVRCNKHSMPSLEPGDITGIRMDVGNEYEPILAEAQLRHMDDDPQGSVLLGFQFIALNDTAKGREMIRRIGQIVLDFQRAANSRRAETA